MSMWAVVLAGGIGSRFWPLSTPKRPKQFLPLVDETPLLLGTLRRMRTLVPPERTLILTNQTLVPSVVEMAREVPAPNIIGEPRPAGTAAALTWAAQEIQRRDGGDAVMICVHADWAIGDVPGFIEILRRAAEAAEEKRGLVTVGIVPTRPDPGFGYIQPGPGAAHDARKVAQFVEKPDRARAEEMVRDGYLWNSGIFAWRVGDFLDEVRAHTPEVTPALDASGGTNAEQFFAAVRPVTVDVGVLERSDRVYVLGGDFGWDDVGTWSALRRVRRGDAAGNAASGNVFALEATNNVVHAEASSVVLYGVSDLVVVSRDGLTLVTTVDRAVDLKKLLDAMPTELRDRP